MFNSRSFVRRLALLALVSTLMLVLAVGGVSAVSGTFDPVSPGSATAPGPTLTAIPDPLQIKWNVPATGVVGVLTYTFQIKQVGAGAFTPIPVPTGETTTAAGVVTWTPVTALPVISAALVNGEYEWNVIATDDNATSGTPGDDTTATSTSFFFVVELPAPDPAFELTSPANNSYLRVASNAQEFTWTESAGATDYNVAGFLISNNVKLGQEIDEDVTAAAACTEGVCTATVDLGAAPNGSYAWTVVASGGESGDVEASNAPWFFSLNTDPIELVTNGGFEIAGADAATAANWTRPLIPGSGRRECRDAKLPSNIASDCAMKGDAILGAMVQKVPGTWLARLALTNADTLSISGLFAANAAPPASSRLQIVFKGAGGTSGKVSIPLAAATYDGTFNALTGTLTGVAIPAAVTEVTAIKIKIVSDSKFFLDDLSIEVDPVAPAPPLAGVVPLPAAP